MVPVCVSDLGLGDLRPRFRVLSGVYQTTTACLPPLCPKPLAGGKAGQRMALGSDFLDKNTC